jgi:hypothetical protein
MGGFFLDDIIRGIVHTVRREMRQRESEKWQLAEGKFKRFEARDTIFGRYRPSVRYSYEVNGETHYGVVKGFELSRKSVDQTADDAEALEAIWVRYNPVDPMQSRVLGGDNPKLPFVVDLNEGE